MTMVCYTIDVGGTLEIDQNLASYLGSFENFLQAAIDTFTKKEMTCLHQKDKKP